MRVEPVSRNSSMQGVGLALVLATLLLAGCATDIKTTHYVGVFDPEQQVMQDLYRVSISGEAPWYSNVRYASGWVPAAHADLLTSTLKHGDAGVQVQGTTATTSPVRAHRRFFEIGPLGISTEPENDRFAIVMGSNPDYFFKKIGMLSRYGTDTDSLAAARQNLLKEIQDEQKDAEARRAEIKD